MSPPIHPLIGPAVGPPAGHRRHRRASLGHVGRCAAIRDGFRDVGGVRVHGQDSLVRRTPIGDTPWGVRVGPQCAPDRALVRSIAADSSRPIWSRPISSRSISSRPTSSRSADLISSRLCEPKPDRHRSVSPRRRRGTPRDADTTNPPRLRRGQLSHPSHPHLSPPPLTPRPTPRPTRPNPRSQLADPISRRVLRSVKDSISSTTRQPRFRLLLGVLAAGVGYAHPPHTRPSNHHSPVDSPPFHEHAAPALPPGPPPPARRPAPPPFPPRPRPARPPPPSPVVTGL